MTDLPTMRGVIVGANFEPDKPDEVHVIVAVPYAAAVVAKAEVFIVPCRDGIVVVDTEVFHDPVDDQMALTRFADYLSRMLPKGVRMDIAAPDDDGVPRWTVTRG
jgi:hypothetical protein